MRKKCVRRTKSVLGCLIAAAALAQLLGITATAQSTNPSELPRLVFQDLRYVGGFRLPNTMSNSDSFSFGGRQMAFNPAGPSLFVGSRAGRVAEVSIPSPVNSSNPDALPFATFLQGLYDPTEGHLGEITGEGVALDSLMVLNNRLYGTASIFYDANNTQRVSHYSRSLQMNESSFSGWSRVWETGKTGFVSGLMAIIPAEWRGLLGGSAITGQCCVPIVTRTSWGPAAFAFDPSKVGEAAVGASPLLYYTDAHPTLGTWNNSNPTYGATITMGGLAVIPGTRTALYFGTNGLGTHCYGTGTSNQSLHLTKSSDGILYCYDPTNADQGSHAYPYRYQIWAYDLNEFAEVKAGRKQPWEVVPYGVWPFELPTPSVSTVKLGNVSYDAAQRILYVSQLQADKDGYSHRAVIHALHVNAPHAINESPAPATAVEIDADRPAPQAAGTTVRFRASPTGGTAPFGYKWLTYDGSSWSARTDWTTSSEYAWTPAVANDSSRVGVWVRSGGNTADAAEVSSEMPFPIEGSRVSSVSLSANRVAPQAAGTSIQWTATASGGAAPHQFKWWVHDGAAWAQIGDWTGSNTYAWTPAAAGGYRVAVWVRGAGSAVVYETTTEAWFTIAARGVAEPAPAPPPPASRVTAVTLAANMTAPQPVNTTITWMAIPNGGVAPHQYQWWVYDGANWTAAAPFGAANTFAWRPTTASPNHRVAVWVRSAGNTGNHEAAAESYFAISSAVVAPVPAPAPTPVARVSSVSIKANLVAPQRPNTTITWTATPVGGVAPHQYQWWVFDGVNWSSQPWTTANTFAWRPATANANYRVAVWVRSAGNTGNLESSTEAYFSIAGGPLQ